MKVAVERVAREQMSGRTRNSAARWLAGTALAGLLAAAAPALAQTTITEEGAAPQRTSDTGDLTVAAPVDGNPAGSITPTEGQTAITVDSSNDVTIGGTITATDQDDVTGVELQGGNAGNLLLQGSISLDDSLVNTDEDDDGFVDGAFAQGSGRTGILISGAAPFRGNVTAEAGSGLIVEGNNSAGVRVADGASLDGDLFLGGTSRVLGDGSRVVDAQGRIEGDVTTAGTVSAQGQGARIVSLAQGAGGTLINRATATNSGFRLTQRPNANFRDDLQADDLLQADAAFQVNGSVAGGIFFQQFEETVTNEDGETEVTNVARSTISQFGAAPALLVDGEGTPISIGVVAEITDANADGFDPALQFAFINQGDLVANGVFDDIGATVFEASDATFEGGISNTGNLQANVFRSGGTEPAPGEVNGARARVIVLGDNSIAERINNGGVILANVTEAADTIFADRANVLAPRDLDAVAIDIAATAEVAELANSGTISAVLVGRTGTAVVVRDASGTLSTIDNTGTISALGTTSDTSGLADTEFNLVALDLRENTVGVSLVQRQSAVSPNVPRIDGDIFLGSGDDVVSVTAGQVLGGIDFGLGADSLTVDGADYDGELLDPDDTLTLTVDNSLFTLRGSQPVRVASAEFGAGTTLRPTIDGVRGTASTIESSGALTFADGARITPILESVVGADNNRFAIARGEQLSVLGDVSDIGAGFAPFLYDTVYTLDTSTNTLFVDFELRDTQALGLDTAQSAAFASTFDALQANDALGRAVVNITDGDVFNSAINQLLPEFSAAARQFVIANADGAVGAVGSQLDAARRGDAQPGGLWVQEFFTYADREKSELSEQYRGEGFGFTAGIDTEFGPFHAVGVNVGFAATEIEDVIGQDEPLSITSALFGAYAGYNVGALSFDGYVGYGLNNFESERLVEIGGFRSQTNADWNGEHFNASLRAGYDIDLPGRFWARPTFSVDYLNLSEDAYTEDGAAGVALSLAEREAEVMAMTAMLNLGAEFRGERTWVRPAIRVGYRNEDLGTVTTAGTFAGRDVPFALVAGDIPENGILLGLSLAAGSGFSSFGFDLDTDIRDGFIRTTGRVVLRLLF